MEGVLAPLLQAKDTPPDAVKEVVPPIHTALAPAIAAVGVPRAAIIFCSVSVHPFASVTVTVKVPFEILIVGLELPVLQLYELPPDAVIDVVLPVQMEFTPEIDAVGNANVEIIFCSVSVQPLESVTVTVKVPDPALIDAVTAPVFQR
jgi:hypothetical protein